MQKIEKYFESKDNFHHFLLIDGFIDATFSFLKEQLEKTFGASQKNGNLEFVSFDKFLIDDVDLLKQRASRKVGQGKQYFHCFGFSIFNYSAQNAVLKILEEPSVGNYFIFVSPNMGNILKTIESRAVILDARGLYADDGLVSKLIKMNFADRQKWITKYANDETKKISFSSELQKKIITELKKRKESPHLVEKFVLLSKSLSRPETSLKQNLEVLLYLLPHKV